MPSPTVELQQPELSAMQKFADRTPEEKAEMFLLLRKLLRDEVEVSQRNPN